MRQNSEAAYIVRWYKILTAAVEEEQTASETSFWAFSSGIDWTGIEAETFCPHAYHQAKHDRSLVKTHAGARSSLTNWMSVVRAAKWSDFTDLRQTFGSADQVKVASGRTTIVFNIAGNRFRLIAAVHYRTEIVFALRFLTDADCSKDQWKAEL